MIQRKQTLFLIVAFVCTVVCMFLPLASFTKGGDEYSLTNLGVINNVTGGNNGLMAALLTVLVLSCVINVFTIFRFKNRVQQSRLCVTNIVLMVVWYAAYALIFKLSIDGADSQSVDFAAILPAVSLVLYSMARHSILADERLVRSADRIR